MFKKLLAFFAAMYVAVSFAAIDVNRATAADLDGIKGIGPAISSKILEERKKGGNFKDWNNLIERVKNVGEGNAAKFSAQGMTVDGASFVATKPAAKKKEKKAQAKPVVATAAATPPAAKAAASAARK